jgi:D-amino-acid dehydrogenase
MERDLSGGNVIVVGAGMVGAACALALARAGRNVALVDPGDMRRAASFGNAGHLAPEQVTPWSSWENVRSFPSRLFGFGGALDFRIRDIGLWGPWSARFLGACAPATLARGIEALADLLADATPAWKRLAENVGRSDIVRLDGDPGKARAPAPRRCAR